MRLSRAETSVDFFAILQPAKVFPPFPSCSHCISLGGYKGGREGRIDTHLFSPPPPSPLDLESHSERSEKASPFPHFSGESERGREIQFRASLFVLSRPFSSPFLSTAKREMFEGSFKSCVKISKTENISNKIRRRFQLCVWYYVNELFSFLTGETSCSYNTQFQYSIFLFLAKKSQDISSFHKRRKCNGVRY